MNKFQTETIKAIVFELFVARDRVQEGVLFFNDDNDVLIKILREISTLTGLSEDATKACFIEHATELHGHFWLNKLKDIHCTPNDIGGIAIADGHDFCVAAIMAASRKL